MNHAFDRLRLANNLSRNTLGADRWSAEEWLKLYDAYEACGWDYTPCRWTRKQVEEALQGLPPQFDTNGDPIEAP